MRGLEWVLRVARLPNNNSLVMFSVCVLFFLSLPISNSRSCGHKTPVLAEYNDWAPWYKAGISDSHGADSQTSSQAGSELGTSDHDISLIPGHLSRSHPHHTVTQCHAGEMEYVCRLNRINMLMTTPDSTGSCI